MKRLFLVVILSGFSLSLFGAGHPMDLSSYIERTVAPGGSYKVIERRLTMHEVGTLKSNGTIKANGKIISNASNIIYRPLVISPTMMSQKTPLATPQAIPQKTPQKMLQKTPQKISQATPQSTPTVQVTNATTKGTVTARPTNMPVNPSKAEIIHMQQDIQHIERKVSRALELSLTAYAVAELPQATEGRSSLSLGMAAADGENGEALGYSSNFGHKHEYTINVSVSHSGLENSAGAGFSYQW